MQDLNTNIWRGIDTIVQRVTLIIIIEFGLGFFSIEEDSKAELGRRLSFQCHHKESKQAAGI